MNNRKEIIDGLKQIQYSWDNMRCMPLFENCYIDNNGNKEYLLTDIELYINTDDLRKKSYIQGSNEFFNKKYYLNADYYRNLDYFLEGIFEDIMESIFNKGYNLED